jgi:hypothetical protein
VESMAEAEQIFHAYLDRDFTPIPRVA